MKKTKIRLILIAVTAAMLFAVSCGKAAPESKVEDVRINASVRPTGQYPESFVVKLSEEYTGERPAADDFHMSGKAGYWGSKDTRSFEAEFESAAFDGDTLTLIPKDFPEKFFYVISYDVICDKDPSLSFSDEDVSETDTLVADDFETLTKEGENGSFEYHLFTPEKTENMPVVVVFHGYGDTNNLLTYRTATEWADPENQAVRPCYVIAPVIEDEPYFAPEGRINVIDGVMDIIRGMEEAGNVDPERVYVMGNSFGGMTSIEMAERYPDDVAGVLALCPALNYSDEAVQNLGKMKDIPVWFLHAENDGTISVEESRKAAEALQELGAGNVRIKEFTDDEMNAAGAENSNESTYSYHHVELAVMEDDTYMEWLYGL